MKKRIVLLAIIILFSVVAVSCSKENDDIIKYYKTAKDAADACGVPVVDFIPGGYESLSYNSVYGIVFEAEFKEKTNNKSENEMAGIAVLRIADAEYNVSNLSGFPDAVLTDRYAINTNEEIEIKTKDGIYMAQWKEKIENTECNISYTVFNDSIYSGTDLLEQYKEMLSDLLEYLEK